MKTALIVTADLGGNLPPLLGVGAELSARGWQVVVHTDEGLRDRVEAAGLRLAPAAGVRYDATQRRSTLAGLRDIPAFWSDRTRGVDAVAAARRAGADVAVVDTLLVGALSELEAAHIPCVVLAHSTWEGTKTFLSGPIGALLRLRGVDAMTAIARADRLLVASSDRLGRPVPMPENGRLSGPVLQDAPTAGSAQGGRPLVLVSLSSVAFPGQQQVLQRVLDAVATVPAEVRAGTGAAVNPTALRPAPNTVVERVVDHGGLMPRASAVVSHGGHATTVRALAHGLPILFLPMHPLMDQPRIARAVTAAGAGLVLAKSARPSRIRAALDRLLAEPGFSVAARSVGAELVAADGARRAADEIAAVAGQSRPVRLQASSDSPPPSASSK